MPSIAERILTRLSYDQAEAPTEHSDLRWEERDDCLAMLQEQFPDFLNRIKGKHILDFGCGTGHQSVAMGMAGAKYVYGVDIQEHLIEHGSRLSAENAVHDRVHFGSVLDDRHHEQFDIAISLDAMEHLEDPESILRMMAKTLKPGGEALISFGPPWYAPYGSHMHFFTPVPWVHLLFPEKAIMTVRASYRNDGAKRFTEVAGGLGKLSVAKFEKIVKKIPELSIASRKFDVVKDLKVIGAIPGVRELFINNVAVVLVKG